MFTNQMRRILSTKFTKYDMQTSPATPLSVLFHQSSKWFSLSVKNLLEKKGYTDLSDAHLSLLANLQCGSTYASAVAAQMGISRQAIYRTTKELQSAGILILEEDGERRNQKIITMTERGMALATDARAILELVEMELAARIGPENAQVLRHSLEAPWGDALD